MTAYGATKKARNTIGRKYAAFRIVLATITPTASHQLVCIAPCSMNHLPRKPAVGGTPIMPSAPLANAVIVHGIFQPMPSSSLISVLWDAV